MTYQQKLNLVLIIIRVLIVLALIAFTALMGLNDHGIWACISFIMAIVASLAPIKGYKEI